GSYRLDGMSRAFGGVVTLKAPGWVQKDPFGGMTADGGAKNEAVVHKDFVMRASATVFGRVVDAAGAPIAGATVNLGADALGAAAAMLGMSGNAVTGGDGSYALFDVDPGAESKGKVSASAPDF